MKESCVPLRPKEFALFFEHYMHLHDAEIVRLEASDAKNTFEIDLIDLCIIDPETDWWRVTDTSVSIIFHQVINLEMSGEFIEYGVGTFELVTTGSFALYAGTGMAKGKFGRLETFATYRSEPPI